MQDYHDRLLADLKKSMPIVIGCHCAVSYSGRAESYLDYNDCILIIKSDKTILVHQTTGNNPINYMKPGTTYTLNVADKRLLIHAEHRQLKEYMDIHVTNIYYYNAHPLAPGSTLILEGTEKDMVEAIMNKPESIEEGFKPVSTEEHTKYGFIDVFGNDTNGTLCVVECKRYTGDFKAVDQLRRYVEKIKDAKGINTVRGILACPSITPNALTMLQDFGFTHVALTPPKRLAKYNKAQTSLGDFHKS